jgi:hypothetical protein
MKILEQSENVLTLQSSAIGFWVEKTLILFSFSFSLFFVVVMASTARAWWVFPFFFLVAIGFCEALADIWKNSIVNFCSFNKALCKVTIKYYGLQAKTGVIKSESSCQRMDRSYDA